MEITIGTSLTVLIGSIFVIFMSYKARSRVAFILSGFSIVPLIFSQYIRNPYNMAGALIVLTIIMLIFDTFPSNN